MYDKNLASQIIVHALKEYPSPIANLSHLQGLLGSQNKDEILNALDALEREGNVLFEPPVRTGLNKDLQGFVNMRLTSAGKAKAERIPPESSGSGFIDPSKSA